jgi:hypothetical protein
MHPRDSACEQHSLSLPTGSSIMASVSIHVEGYSMKKVGDLYECQECHLLYNDERWAKKCEEWCTKHKSCNLEITKHAAEHSKLSLS